MEAIKIINEILKIDILVTDLPYLAVQYCTFSTQNEINITFLSAVTSASYCTKEKQNCKYNVLPIEKICD